MKRKFLLIALFALALATPLMANAADSNGKDLCLLNSENCPNRTMDILQIIAKLKAEIGKGAAVYTDHELDILSAKLENYNKELDALQGP